MDEVARMEERQTELRQLVFPKAFYHKATGKQKVFFGLDEYLIHEKQYTDAKPALRTAKATN